MDDALLLIILGAASVGLVWGAWLLARRKGLWAGLTIPGLLGAGFALRQAMPIGHPEEAMGRGLEVMFVWLPLLGLTLGAAALGLLARRLGD